MSNINDKAERGSVISTILEVLKDGEKYGYEIIKEVEQKTGVVLKQPSLYSCLTRLETQGIITSYWKDSDIGGRRHYYMLAKNNKPQINIQKDESENFEESDEFDFENFETISNSIKISNESQTLDTTINFLENENEFDEFETIENRVQESEEIALPSTRLISISNIIMVETETNNSEISFIENEILAANEIKDGIPQQISMIDTNTETNLDKYENILGEMLYDNKGKEVPKKKESSAQQFFNFDQDEIKVENDKNYLNNVLLKTAKTEMKNEQVKRKKQVYHFTKIEDLKTHFSDANINVSEYSYLNYETSNKKRYISSTLLSVFMFLKLSIYIALCFWIFKNDICSMAIKSSIIIFLCLAFFEGVISFFFLSNNSAQKKYYVYNLPIVLIISLFELIVTFLFAFSNSYASFLTAFTITNLLIFAPIVINLTSLFFSKKASKFSN